MPSLKLQKLEKLVIHTVALLHGKAYGVTILEGIEEQLEKPVNVGAVQLTLKRLESKGYLKSTLGGATDMRGGRRKRLFTITNFGRNVVKAHDKQ